MAMTPSTPPPQPRSEIWWSNGIFFVLLHVAAAIGVYYYPIYSVPRATLVLSLVLTQAAMMAITVGYHRLYSHRAFRAAYSVRVLLALLGASAMQGSIKVSHSRLIGYGLSQANFLDSGVTSTSIRSVRHRLHHRFTDDPIHDPYAASRGFLWSHMGWIFFKSRYERMELIDKDDLDRDPVVQFQHQYFIPLAVVLGLVAPPFIGLLWGDFHGCFVWAALVARLLIWHSTFFVNSLAHWDGLQPYTDENTSKSNLVGLNFLIAPRRTPFNVQHTLFFPTVAVRLSYGLLPQHHAFPHDYRSGPDPFDWDPSKWAILLLRLTGLASGLKQARPSDISEAQDYMLHKVSAEEYVDSSKGEKSTDDWEGDRWTFAEVKSHVEAARLSGRCILIIDGYVIDATSYLGEHPGGSSLLRAYSTNTITDLGEVEKRAAWAFNGGMNNHSRAAKKRLQELRVAQIAPTL
ncbi:uncharacterized protein FIBRA_00128 [Fibroporia radiculosa]|uniref:Acyl-CoA desaturase n=1 Tax=Fibroporia radiculosa TaxID=599839 RepID=J7S5P1_9APHY|nr:uncharacterized protein FIBRA_00128 [Fibroporia radiculosa]CCL98134.1 predicted protein [Fibroporia radiculosa]